MPCRAGWPCTSAASAAEASKVVIDTDGKEDMDDLIPDVASEMRSDGTDLKVSIRTVQYAGAAEVIAAWDVLRRRVRVRPR